MNLKLFKIVFLFMIGLCPFTVPFAYSEDVPQSQSQNFIIQPWAVGQTVTLQTKIFKDGNLFKTYTRTYSIVGQNTVKGKNYFWLEVEIVSSDGVTETEKMQVRQPEGVDFENAVQAFPKFLKPRRKLLLREGASRHLYEIKIPAESVTDAEDGPLPAGTKDLSGEYLSLPEEPITVTAGVFNARKFQHVKFVGGPSTGVSAAMIRAANKMQHPVRVWGSPDVPIVGLIKKSSNNVQTELLSYSLTGAVSKVKTLPSVLTKAPAGKVKYSPSAPAPSAQSNINFKKNKKTGQ